MSIKGFSVGGNVERYDYNFLDNLPSEITIDTALSDSSTNPVQNRVVTSAINSANGSISSISGEVDDLKSSLGDVNSERFGNDDVSNTVDIQAMAGKGILATKKIIDVSIPAGTVYAVKFADANGVINGNSINPYAWDANGNKTSIAYNLGANTWYWYKASADIFAFSIYVDASKVVNTGTFEFNLLFPNASNNQIDAGNIVSGNYDNTTGVPYRVSAYSRLLKPIICTAGTVVISTKNMNAYEKDVLTGEFIRSNGGWTKRYIVQNDCALLLSWQSAVSNAQTLADTTYVLPTQTVLADTSIPLNSIENLSKRFSRNFIQSATVKSIAHRGNYLHCRGMMCGASAVVSAKKYGYQITENDVALSSDGKMVMWHDTTLSAIGDSNHSVSDYTLAQLKEMDFGSAFGSQYAGEKILTFAEWILLCKQVGLDCYIDFKVTGSAFTDALAEEMVSTIRRYGMLNHVTYLSNFNVIRQYHPNARLATLTEPTAENIQTYAPYLSNGEFVFNPKSTTLTSENASLALDNGFGLECWYVDYSSSTTSSQIFAEIERVLSLGVQGLTLDIYRVEDYFIDKYGLAE